MSLVFYFLAIITLEFTLWIGYCCLRSRALSKKTKNFVCEDKVYQKRVLMIGDSVIRGVGTSHGGNSLPALITKHSPAIHVTVCAQDGARCREVLQVCREKRFKKFHQVILFCGGMDIIYFSRTDEIKRNLAELFSHAKSISPNVVYVSPADVGSAPVFPFPISYIYTYRSRKFLDISRECAKTYGVTFVDYFSIRNTHYAEDKSHPNDNGYRNLFNLFKHHIVE